MPSSDVIREARLRAGLSQHELAARSGRDRSVIARWEQGVVSPSLDTLVEIVHACGFDLPLELVPRNDAADEGLRRNARLSPERRLQQMLRRHSKADADGPALDPYAIIATLERHRVGFVVLGGLARVIHGADEITHGLDITPSLRDENLRRLNLALTDLGVEHSVGTGLLEGGERVIEVLTQAGQLRIVPQPAGTRQGYADLRRAATREPIGKGLRPSVASVGDLARMLAALGRNDDLPRLRQLRRLAEFERGLSGELLDR